MKRYGLLVIAGIGLAAVLGGLMLVGNLNQNLVYYLTPQEANAKRADFPDDRRFQLGGFVEPGSVTEFPGGLRFSLAETATPGGNTINVEYRGAPAQLFQAGIGVVLEGNWRGDEFISDTMKVKHDENYQPPAPADTGS